MKYLITESQFDNIVFKYLDNQDFIQIEKNNIIYFVNSDGDEYAQIRFDKDDGLCLINNELIKEISSFFSLKYSDSEKVIGRWVENTLQMKVTNTHMSNWRMPLLVENTLQMKVTNTSRLLYRRIYLLRIPSK
jgi:hypothetical protein